MCNLAAVFPHPCGDSSALKAALQGCEREREFNFFRKGTVAAHSFACQLRYETLCCRHRCRERLLRMLRMLHPIPRLRFVREVALRSGFSA